MAIEALLNIFRVSILLKSSELGLAVKKAINLQSREVGLARRPMPSLNEEEDMLIVLRAAGVL